MNRLRQPGDSDYDVLGVSSEATPEEIDHAFRWLIDGERYRVGIPLNRQWLRAQQIKAAYATLRPAKQRSYRQAMSRADRAHRVGTVDDPAKDEPVVPMAKQRPAEFKKGPDPTPGVRTNAASAGPEWAPVRTPAPRVEELIGMVGKGPPPPDLSPPLDGNEGESASAPDNKRASVRSWGVATAIVFGLGLVLIASWPEQDREPLAVESAPAVTPDGRQASGVGRAPVKHPAQAAGRPIESQGSSNEGTAREAGEIVPRAMTNAQSPAAMKPTGTMASAEKASSPARAAETRAIAPSQNPPVSRAPVTRNARVGTGSRSRPIGTAPQWLGGGPTNADNRQGRYQGKVALQVNVEPSGRVSKCAPVRGSGNAELDALTCRLVRERARFTPAIDSRGRPVVGQAYTSFVWVPGQRN